MGLLPSLKQKKRYVVFSVISKGNFTLGEISDAVEKALLHFLGEFGVAKASPMMIKEKFKNQKFIIKVNHHAVDECKTALMLITKIKNEPVVMRSVTTSGTLKKASQAL